MAAAWNRYLPLFVKQRLEGRHQLHRIIANTGWLFADKLIRMGMGLLVGVWVARYLGPDQFGLLNFAGAFAALFTAIASLGLDGIVVRNLVRRPGERNEILGTALLLKLTGGSLSIALAMIAVRLMRPADTLTHWLVGIAIAGTIFQAIDPIDFWFQSQVRSKYTVYAKNGAFLLTAILKVILILVKAPLMAFAMAGLAEIAMGSIGLLLAYRATGGFITVWRARLPLARELLRDSWPLILSGVVIMIYMRIDQVMIGQISGNQEVGVYSAAVRLAEVWYFIPTAVVSSVFPGIVEARAIGDEPFYGQLQKLYNFMAFLAYAVALPVTFIAGPVVNILFGSAYEKAGPMLAVLIWAGLFTNLGVARSSFLTAMNWTRLHFLTVSLGCVINVGLNFLLIPRYGGMGAVIASFVAYWFASHGACFLFPPLRKTGWMLTRAMIYPRIW
ncbi:MAG: flippase [Deltaproteobacteria bacterium]|nr:flippase [Deltaproteobacteria bacterium]